MSTKYKLVLNPVSQIVRDKGLNSEEQAQRFHTQNVLRRIQKYMPYRTGTTIKLTIAQTDINKPEIVTDTPYARYLFYGYAMEGKAPKRVTDRPLKYTKTKNPKRKGRDGTRRFLRPRATPWLRIWRGTSNGGDNVTALETVKEWIATYPGHDILSAFSVDYTDPRVISRTHNTARNYTGFRPRRFQGCPLFA